MDENINAGATPAVGGSNKTLYVVIAVIVLALVGWMLMRNKTNSEGVDIDRNADGSTTHSNEEGSATVGGTSLPSNWPSDVPAYAGAVITYSGTSNPSTGEAGAAVMFTTKDSTATVATFYKEQLVATGWTISAEANANGMTTLAATKDTRNFGMYIAPVTAGADTTVTIGISGE